MPLSNEQETALPHRIRNTVKEELQAHEILIPAKLYVIKVIRLILQLFVVDFDFTWNGLKTTD